MPTNKRLMLTLTEIQEIPGQETRQSGKETIYKVCPLCGNENFKFYVNSEHLVYDCKVCAESGKISKKLNKEVNPTKYHEKLMAGEDGVLDYLAVDRHLTEGTIKHFQLGSHNGNLFIPFFRKGKCVYWKLRILNPSEGESKYKNAASPVQLFNQDVISSGIDILFIVEGEIDAMSLHQLGYINVVAVPGANTKKNEWLKLIDESTVTKIYLIYDNDAVGQKAAHAMAEKIGIQKCWNVVLDTDKDINELLGHENVSEIIKKAIEEAEQFKLDGVKNLDDATEMLIAKLEQSGTGFTYTTSWWPSLARKMGGYEPGDLIGIIAEGKVGKAQPPNTPILTTEGWKNLKDLRIGDSLASVDGAPSTITDIITHKNLEMCEVEFCDGRKTQCCVDHLWLIDNVSNKYDNGPKVLNTSTIKNMLETYKDTYCIPTFCGKFGDKKELPISPYLLGVLLGNGTLNKKVMVSQRDVFVKNEFIRELQHTPFNVSNANSKGIYTGFRIIKADKTKKEMFYTLLQELNLLDKDCFNKFIPSQYLLADYSSRLALLQGLMDSDGYISRGGSTSYSTSSIQLAKDVQYLVRSLGGISEITEKYKFYTYKGKKLPGKVNYSVTVKIQNRSIIFRLPRKKQRAEQVAIKKLNRLTFKNVKLLGKSDGICLSVSHPSRLYITNDFIVTHNSTAVINWLYQHARLYKESVALMCLEMPVDRQQRKLVSYVTQAADDPDNSEITVEKVKESRAIMDSEGITKDDFLFIEAPKDLDSIFKKIEDVVRVYGVTLVGFDNLHLLVRNTDNPAAEINVLSKKFKALSMKLNVPIILLLQPNRVAEGKVVTARNAMGSSGIEKDVDYMICLHRKRILSGLTDDDLENMPDLNTEAVFEPTMYVNVDLSRYSAGGMCKLYIDGTRSTIKEIPYESPEPIKFTTKLEEV